ncbi:3-methyladenine DNA glycosylase, partial [Oleiphilus sp. HI0085]
LRKEKSYYEAYDNFDPKRIAEYDQTKIDELLLNSGVIRNKLKVNSIIKNAREFLEIEKNEGDFSKYLWSFVGAKPIVNSWRTMADVPAVTPESEAMSKDLKKRGFTFVGPTICYAFMQAVGMVNDHLVTCPEWSKVS